MKFVGVKDTETGVKKKKKDLWEKQFIRIVTTDTSNAQQVI